MAKLHYKLKASDSDQHKFKKYLSEDEKLVLATGYGKTYLRQRFIIQLLIPGALFILAAIIYFYFFKHLALVYGLIWGFFLSILWSILQTWIIYQSHRYLLTTRRVIIKNGFFYIRLSSDLYDKITHIEVDQGLVDRFLLHHGKVIVNTAGANKDELILKYVEYPVEFKNILERLIHQEREYFRGSGEALEVVEGEVIDE